jgi:hyaluronan synthase
MRRRKKKEKTEYEDVLLMPKKDRRYLPNVPDPTGERSVTDRRGTGDKNADFQTMVEHQKSGIRYNSVFTVTAVLRMADGKREVRHFTARDISMTGMLLTTENEADADDLANAERVRLKFRIPPGAMPEGLESIRIRVGARVVRCSERAGEKQIGLEFHTDLNHYLKVRKDNLVLMLSSLLLFFITAFVVLMRAESVIYFKFNRMTYLYSIVAAVFLLSRYFFGALYRPVPVDSDFTPGVTIIIPCFNEEEWIQTTIRHAMDQDYPPSKLEVIVVDDCSTDHSVEKIREIIRTLSEGEGERYDVANRLSYYVQPHNAGKREALAAGSHHAKHDLLVFVDSDSFLDPYAIRNLVQPFRDPLVGGVAGRTDVANTYTNSLSRMQSVRYYISFRIMKAAESIFDTVTCLSGPLSCYRKSIVLENEDRWLGQTFLGQKATFGDDRAMTNFVLRHHRTVYQDTAICSTIVPNDYPTFLRQQMRWKRSWLRESLICGSYIWRKEPFASLCFYIGLMVPILAPLIVIYNLAYVPITQHIFPTTFLVGLLLMSLLMSISQLALRKSTTWIFGMFFCFYYEMVLLWQMPIAIVTFWKSTWGTRMTANDVEAEKAKEAKENQSDAGLLSRGVRRIKAAPLFLRRSKPDAQRVEAVGAEDAARQAEEEEHDQDAAR